MLQAPCLLMAVVKTLKRLLFATPVSRGFYLFEWKERDLDFSFLLASVQLYFSDMPFIFIHKRQVYVTCKTFGMSAACAKLG